MTRNEQHTELVNNGSVFGNVDTFSDETIKKLDEYYEICKKALERNKEEFFMLLALKSYAEVLEDKFTDEHTLDESVIYNCYNNLTDTLSDYPLTHF